MSTTIRNLHTPAEQRLHNIDSPAIRKNRIGNGPLSSLEICTSYRAGENRHLVNGCRIARESPPRKRTRLTTIHRHVRCKLCKAKILRQRLQCRTLFPQVPTFLAREIGDGYCAFCCPVCGATIIHAAENGECPPRCKCWSFGYRIQIVD